MSADDLMNRIEQARNSLDSARQLVTEAQEILGIKDEPPPEPEERGFFDKAWGAISDHAHTGLDLAGFLPVVGTAADLVNAGLYAAEGDYTNASLSALGAIPIVGDAAMAGKLGAKATNAAIDVAKNADNATDAAKLTPGVPPQVQRKDYEKISGQNRKKFMNEQLRIIKNDDSHPLHHLLNSDGDKWIGRDNPRVSEKEIGVQAGHLTSRHGLQPGELERFAIEDGYLNQSDSYGKPGEWGGAIFDKKALDIGGVPIEARTANMYAELGYLDKDIVKNAPEHPGWTAPSSLWQQE